MATTPPPVSDQETRQRLLEAAVQLFAERGFQNVTVRDICAAAEANVAAVNYYFRDKWGLYKEILEGIIEQAKRDTQAAHEARAGMSAEDRLRNYIRVFLRNLIG